MHSLSIQVSSGSYYFNDNSFSILQIQHLLEMSLDGFKNLSEAAPCLVRMFEIYNETKVLPKPESFVFSSKELGTFYKFLQGDQVSKISACVCVCVSECERVCVCVCVCGCV